MLLRCRSFIGVAPEHKIIVLTVKAFEGVAVVFLKSMKSNDDLVKLADLLVVIRRSVWHELDTFLAFEVTKRP
jgi:hypothetical protein